MGEEAGGGKIFKFTRSCKIYKTLEQQSNTRCFKFDLYLGACALYPLHYVTYAPTKFEAASSMV